MSVKIDRMRIATAVSHSDRPEEVAAHLSEAVGLGLDGQRVDLCMLFASAHYEEQIDSLTQHLTERLGPRAFVGATAEAVICGEREYERQPAVVIWAASLPGVTASAFHLTQEDLERLNTPEGLAEHIGVSAADRPYFLLMGDPFSTNISQLLTRMEAAFPGRPCIGGMASAGERPGQNRLIFNGAVLQRGISGVELHGNLQIDTLVSQGCRPIGRHMVITRGEQNLIHQLGGRAARTALEETLRECPPADLDLIRTRGLLIGRVINEYQPNFGPGDFLIRNPLGFDESGALAVNDFVRTGQTVQFHVRDGRSAGEDLDALLGESSGPGASGALLFTCNGRGTRLFSAPHRDARAVADACGAPPLAGFFAAGEIGPVGRRNFVHGHTASIAFFRASDPRLEEG